MRTPFPGMDPYLEHPALWEGFHTCLIVEIMRQLQPLLVPRYVATVEQRVFLGRHQVRKPDVRVLRTEKPREESRVAVMKPRSRSVTLIDVEADEVKQRRIEILDRRTGMQLVTSIEVVSPTNKTGGEGRRSYRRKQSEFLHRECHLVEIDLLRKGKHVVAAPEWRAREADPEYDYLTSVSRWPNRGRFELYFGHLRAPLAAVSIPLRVPDQDILLDLKKAIDDVWTESGYVWQIAYDKPCFPALSPEDQRWASGCWRRWRKANPSASAEADSSQ